MPPMPESYAFLDCGDGRRLERFGSVLAVRPAPAAVFPPALAKEEWDAADLAFDRQSGWRGAAPKNWRVRFGSAVMNLRTAAGGQVGVFPEHDAVCRKLESALARRPAPKEGWRVLNLFAHTGLATLRLAALPGMAEIVHLDAAPAAVRQARDNAVASGLVHARIRWVVDDAMEFLAREARRDREYDIILADPPAYGRNRKTGGEWRLERDLLDLLLFAGQLLRYESGLFCLTCHPSGWSASRAERVVKAALPAFAQVRAEELFLRPESGGDALPAGLVVVGTSN